VEESGKRGNVDMQRLRELGVRPGPHIKALVEGRDLVLPDGRVFKPSEVRELVGGLKGGWDLS
jgi:hypothetical protein